MPRGCIKLNILNPSAHGKDNIVIKIALNTIDFFKLQPHKSCAKERIFWKTAMIVERAAKLINRKKKDPHMRLPGISLNTFGSVINTRFGPLSGLTPKAEQAGKIIRPAISATIVSKTATLIASPVSLRLLSI